MQNSEVFSLIVSGTNILETYQCAPCSCLMSICPGIHLTYDQTEHLP